MANSQSPGQRTEPIRPTVALYWYGDEQSTAAIAREITDTLDWPEALPPYVIEYPWIDLDTEWQYLHPDRKDEQRPTSIAWFVWDLEQVPDPATLQQRSDVLWHYLVEREQRLQTTQPEAIIPWALCKGRNPEETIEHDYGDDDDDSDGVDE